MLIISQMALSYGGFEQCKKCDYASCTVIGGLRVYDRYCRTVWVLPGDWPCTEALGQGRDSDSDTALLFSLASAWLGQAQSKLRALMK